jgi:hypothetical protein
MAAALPAGTTLGDGRLMLQSSACPASLRRRCQLKTSNAVSGDSVVRHRPLLGRERADAAPATEETAADEKEEEEAAW